MKLTGQAYIDYWRRRMAKGPDEAGFNGRDAVAQGDAIWEFIRPHIAGFSPRSVFEFGCGYGRMLRKLYSLWQTAAFSGADLSGTALGATLETWPDPAFPPLLCVGSSLPGPVDLIFTCLALQHVTDDEMFSGVVEDFRKNLRPGGHLVLFENVCKHGADHLRDMSSQSYMDLWPELEWIKYDQLLILNLQVHALLIGRKA